ncbi:MAG: hypothetical protein K6G92_01720 [Bacteroidaceae bacterium]|nr:hypothetical protein [Bacteroidaceae bacterium]
MKKKYVKPCVAFVKLHTKGGILLPASNGDTTDEALVRCRRNVWDDDWDDEW